MVNGISGMGGMQRPAPQDFFKKVDGDSSGGVSQAELKALSEEMQKKAGKTLDTSESAFAGYDSNGDGSLSSDELKSVMENSGFGPPVEGQQGVAPPPPPPQQAMSAYDSNSGSGESAQDTIASLIDNLKTLLEELSANSSANSDGTDSESSNAGLGGVSMPSKKDFLAKVDSDSSGGISKDELKALSENLSKMTGQGLDVSDEAFTEYDKDGDGALNADELKIAMDKNGFQPPPPPGGMMARSSDQNGQTASVSRDDQLSQLKALLETLTKYSSKGASDGSSSFSLLSITS